MRLVFGRPLVFSWLGGELFDFLNFTGCFEEAIARTYFHQVLSIRVGVFVSHCACAWMLLRGHTCPWLSPTSNWEVMAGVPSMLAARTYA